MTDAAPRETDELWPFTVLVDQQPVTTGVQACITAYGARPSESDWTDAVVRDGKTYLRVSGRAPGDQAWARGTRGDEHAVIFRGVLPLF